MRRTLFVEVLRDEQEDDRATSAQLPLSFVRVVTSRAQRSWPIRCRGSDTSQGNERTVKAEPLSLAVAAQAEQQGGRPHGFRCRLALGGSLPAGALSTKLLCFMGPGGVWGGRVLGAGPARGAHLQGSFRRSKAWPRPQTRGPADVRGGACRVAVVWEPGLRAPSVRGSGVWRAAPPSLPWSGLKDHT